MPLHLGRRRSTLFLATAFLCILLLATSFAFMQRPRDGNVAALVPSAALTLALQPYASGFSSPVNIANSGVPGDGRLFVVERRGRIRIIDADGSVRPTPFLDISDRVDASSIEEGLIGLAFHPNYAQNRYVYVSYTNTTNDVRRTRISRFRARSNNPNAADPNSESILLTVEQPYATHNGSTLQFGPDGFLYLPFGDGGGQGNPEDTAQNRATLLGKIARIDVGSRAESSAADCTGQGNGNYKIPASNPLRGSAGACDEIWAIGLRNPWRVSFDRATADLYIADVGQNTREEVDFQPADSAGGENYGWRCYEGTLVFNAAGCLSRDNYVFPVFEYATGDNCSIIGGYVYRGGQSAALYGRYVLTDYCSGYFWDLVRDGDTWRATRHTNLVKFGYVSIAEGIDGELYVANIDEGIIYHLTATGPAATVTPSATAVAPTPTASGTPRVTATPTSSTTAAATTTQTGTPATSTATATKDTAATPTATTPMNTVYLAAVYRALNGTVTPTPADP